MCGRAPRNPPADHAEGDVWATVGLDAHLLFDGQGDALSNEDVGSCESLGFVEKTPCAPGP